MLKSVRFHSENARIVVLKESKSRISLFLQVTQYLLDKALIIDEDTLYELSLKIEPRLPAWRSGLAPDSVEFSWKVGRTELSRACHASHVQRGPGIETKPVSFVHRRRWNPTGILSPAREAQLFGVNDRCFRLGWEGETIDP